MSDNSPEIPDDPINDESSDWEEAGLPAQEDSTEDSPLPTDREGPAVMGGVTSIDTDTGETLDEALAREEPDSPEAGGSTARPKPDEDETVIAEDAARDRGPRSGEEQAVHEREETEEP